MVLALPKKYTFTSAGARQPQAQALPRELPANAPHVVTFAEYLAERRRVAAALGAPCDFAPGSIAHEMARDQHRRWVLMSVSDPKYRADVPEHVRAEYQADIDSGAFRHVDRPCRPTRPTPAALQVAA